MLQANLLLSRPFIKINACLIGYGLWMILSQHQIITRTLQVPVCFYNTPENSAINAPDTVNIIIQGSKKSLERCDIYNSSIHIDASKFQFGYNYIILEKANLFLPDEIKLLNLLPALLPIQLQKNE